MKPPTKGKIFTVTCLVAGTCIGGGMLALPVATGLAGFIPALVMMAFSGLFMIFTGLLFIEATLWMEPGAHFMTLSHRLLGPFGRFIVAVLFLFIGYASLIAYTAGGGGILIAAGEALTGVLLDRWVADLMFAAAFGIIVVLGRWIVGQVNAILFIGMVLAYLVLVIGGIGEISGSLLIRRAWTQGGYALPLLLAIFSYQAVVPSLVIHLDRDVRALRISLIGGVIVAFVIYSVWVALIFGIVPLKGPYGLELAFREGSTATQSFGFHVDIPWISAAAEFFAFFALVTSFLGIGLGLYDFLADGLHLRKRWGHRPLLTLLVIVPSVTFAILYPRAFLVALDTSGGFGDAVLNGMIPVCMVWSGRYIKKQQGGYRVRGGRPLLAILFIFASLVLVIELLERIKMIQPLLEIPLPQFPT